MKKKLVWHLGLGDAIICAGIAVKLAQEHGDLAVYCWRHNLISVQSFFVNHPEITVIPLDSEAEFPNSGPEVIHLGYFNKELPRLQGENFDDWFFRQAGMTSEEVRSFCPITKIWNLPEYVERVSSFKDQQNYAFLHQDESRGFKIDLDRIEIPVMLPRNKKFSILENVILMSLATEIHCIDSSFLHLADRVFTTGKLFYHKYARPNSENITLTKNWTIYEA